MARECVLKTRPEIQDRGGVRAEFISLPVGDTHQWHWVAAQ